MRRLAGYYANLLEAIASDADRNVSSLPIFTDAERQQRLVDWNNTAVEFPGKTLCLHQMIEEQAARTPDQVALVFDEEELTFGELNRRANQLAHYLKGLGVGPDVLVGVYVQRSIEMVVGMLGILKAGGAYVPIDPSYPSARIALVIEVFAFGFHPHDGEDSRGAAGHSCKHHFIRRRRQCDRITEPCGGSSFREQK